MNNRFRVAYTACIATGTLGVIAACGIASSASHTSDVHPTGTYHGIRLCAYDLDDDGIEIHHHEKTPCVVTDARSKKDRKKKAVKTSTPGAVPAPTKGRTPTATGLKTFAPTTAAKAFKAPKASKTTKH